MSDGTVLDTVDSDRLAENSYRQMVDYLENILMRQLERVRLRPRWCTIAGGGSQQCGYEHRQREDT